MNPASLNDRALKLSYFTVGYNVLEGAASVAAGALAGSVALVGFGLDSFIESLSGSVMIWRFRHRAGGGPEAAERREQRAVRLVGYTFFVLAAYVAYEAVAMLLAAEPPGASVAGIVITALSLVVMPVLYVAKRRTGEALGSRSLAADAKQTFACVLLSAAVLAGLLLNATLGLWQVDPLLGLAIAAFLVKEGRAALRDGTVCRC